MPTPDEKITKAKMQLVLNQPFFAIIALSTEFISTEDAGNSAYVKTMATDGKVIWWNPEFVEQLSQREIAGVIAHEVMHIAWLHPLRRGLRDPFLWNIACDYAINPIVLDSGFALPTSDELKPCYDEKYLNWSADQIYQDLMKKAIKINISMVCDDGSGQPKEGNDTGGKMQGQLWGTIIDPKGADGKELSEADKSELEEEIKIKVKQAAENAKAIGKLPGALQGLIEAIGKPKINWKDYIQSWVSGKIPDNYSWARPNRKFMANFRIYMPRMQLNGAGVGVLSIDTSGSVSDEELRDYVREIAGVIEICNPDKLYIIQHDAIVQRIDEWEAGEDFSGLKISGRGGTNITPVFKKLDQLDDQIDWMICFTDMGIGDYPSADKAPDFPVLWCATGPDNAPFGTYLPLKDAI